MEYLIKKNARIDIIDDHGYSLVNFAATTGQLNKKIYELCKSNGLKFNEQLNLETDFIYIRFFSKIVVIDLHTIFFDGFSVFFRFLAEIRFRTIMKLPQKASSRTKTCSFDTSVTLP